MTDIGEKKRNLSDATAHPEPTEPVLLVDEADAVFARRSEVRDAHDRYANAEGTSAPSRDIPMKSLRRHRP